MTIHRYPLRAVGADYLRAAVGLLFTVVPLIATGGDPLPAVIFGGLALVFAAFAARTAFRQATRVEASDAALSRSGISTFGWGRVTVPWGRVSDVTLRYFSTRRDRERGWLQLTIRADGRSITMDSTIEGFEEITRRTAAAAGANHLSLSPATMENFLALGLDPAQADLARTDGPGSRR